MSSMKLFSSHSGHLEVEKGKIYFSRKQKLCGYKVEVSVLYGLAVGCTSHYPGSVSDFQIIQHNIDWNEERLSKEQGNQLVDSGEHSYMYPRKWALLSDQIFQGILEVLHSIHPCKKPIRDVIYLSDEADNRKESSDRIVVENYFGRLCSLWILLSRKWRLSEGIFDDFYLHWGGNGKL